MSVLEELSSRHNLVRNSGGPVALEPHTCLFDCGVSDLVRSPEGEHAFKAKVGVFQGTSGLGRVLQSLPPWMDWGAASLGPALWSQLAD